MWGKRKHHGTESISVQAELDEALSYLERRLHEIGVVKALRDAGFESGDEVRVGEQAFELE